MPGLKLFTSNRMETLAAHLSDVLRVPLSQPLAPEIILVQSRGMERWLSMELALRHGVCANVRYPYPIHFIQNVFKEILPCAPERSPYEPAILTWDIMGLLPSLLDHPGFEILKGYLGGDLPDLKLFQLSCRIADLFDQYLLFRPDMILRWDRGHHDHWQAVLWRELVKKHGATHRASLYASFLNATGKGAICLRNMPERISLFGISALPPFHIEILSALSPFMDVNLFLMNPCGEFWGDIASDREMSRVTARETSKGAAPEDLYLESGNRLLASMGALGRDFFQLLGDIPYEETSFYEDPKGATLLSAIQCDILHLKNRNADDENAMSVADDSIRVHSCHSPLREIEVLQDALLDLFERQPEISPDDVLVMIPDIELYAPFVQAVFSLSPDDPRRVPFTIADRGLLSESGLIDTFMRILDLAGSRYEASRVMDILEAGPVRAKFSFSEEDLALIHHWIRETAIRWGIDGESREKLGLPAFPWNTWRMGLDRMLLGYALPSASEDGLFMGIPPFRHIEGGSTETMGNFLAFAETLFLHTTSLEQRKTLNEWAETLVDILHSFLSDDEEYLRDIQAIRRIVRALVDIQTGSGFAEKVGLDVIKAWLKQNLKERGFGAGFLTGGVTFCAILPMRSIPFKVICLVGMNDDAYPRQSRKLGFDLMAASPRRGDRSRRVDDRYLFLEAILSARLKLHISYAGQSLKDNSPRPPSVLVNELLDYIEEGFGTDIREEVCVTHRLQAFNPEYFTGKGKLFSYSMENSEAARSAVSTRMEPSSFIPSAISEPGDEWKTIDLEALILFFSNPSKYLLNRRLGIYLREEDAAPDDCEPFELNNLDTFFIRQDLAAHTLEGKPLGYTEAVMQASGVLPYGTPGALLYDDLLAKNRIFIRRIECHLEGGKQMPVEVDLTLNGFHLTGRLANIYSGGFVAYRPAKMKGRDRFRAWISHLVFNHVRPDASPRETVLICEDRAIRYRVVTGTGERLAELLNLYWRGLRKPIHFFSESSLAFAEAIVKGNEKEKALRAAVNKWEGYEFGEKDNPYYSLCFGQIDPLDEEFASLATSLYEPMFQHEIQIT